jgi:hypothetical protein
MGWSGRARRSGGKRSFWLRADDFRSTLITRHIRSFGTPQTCQSTKSLRDSLRSGRNGRRRFSPRRCDDAEGNAARRASGPVGRGSGSPDADIDNREALAHDQKLRHERFGQSSERGALLDQLEFQLADLEENAAQAETAAQLTAAKNITVPSFERRKPVRRPLPEHLPRERFVYPRPATCPC